MNTIAYDQPIEDLIDKLDATGHVSHRSYPKKSVTFHHNAGKDLSHEEVLAVWTYRPASAHFDVDAEGALAQYVRANEYAWAVGNTVGNEETISIELTNSSLEPRWEIADVTWQAGARLAGWLFVHEIEGSPHPTKENVFPHHYWSKTSCPGPYLDSIFDVVVEAVQAAYDHFKGHAPAKPTEVQQLQKLLEVPADNKWGRNTDHRALILRAAARTHAGWPHNSPQSFDIREVQGVVGVRQDGIWGHFSQAALIVWIHAIQHVLGVAADGNWGPDTDHAYLILRKQHLNKF